MAEGVGGLVGWLVVREGAAKLKGGQGAARLSPPVAWRPPRLSGRGCSVSQEVPSSESSAPE